MGQENFLQSEPVSIVIPVYNGEQFLARCLNSVISQSYQNLDIIVVNDGSTDDTLTISESFRQRDARIHVISQKNGGLSAARNAGLDQANGKYVYFLDCDDWIEPTLISRAVREMHEKSCELVAFSLAEFYEDEQKSNLWQLEDRVVSLHSEYERLHFVAADYMACGIRFEVWNKLFRMDIIKEHRLRFVDNRIIFAEDICFLSAYLIYTKKISVLSDVLYHYMIRVSSLSNNAYSKKRMELTRFIRLAEVIWKYYRENCGSSYLYRHFEYIYASLMHDQYKRVDILQLPDYLHEIEENAFFRYMTERAYNSRLHFPRFFGFRYGDLLADESFIAAKRGQQPVVHAAGRLIDAKRNVRTWIKRRLETAGKKSG